MNLIKVTESADINALSLLAKEIWTECYSEILPQGQVEYMTDKYLSPTAISQQIENEDYEYCFLESDGAVAGFTAFKTDEVSLFLSKLYVKKEYREKGLASFVMKSLEERCIKDKLSYIWLTVNVNNHTAINAYKKKGFVIFKDECTDIGGGYVMDDHFMKKVIDT